MQMPRRVLSLILALCMSLCVLTVPSVAVVAEEVTFQNYREIPGANNVFLDAVLSAYRVENKPFVYGMVDSSESFQYEDGRYGGFSARFCEWMSKMFGVQFELRIYTWDGLMAAIDSGEVDFTGEFTATPEMQEKYIMSETFAERTIKLYRLRGSDDLSETGKGRTVRYGYMKDHLNMEEIVASASYPTECMVINNLDNVADLLRARAIDAFVLDEHITVSFPDDIIVENAFPSLYSSASVSTPKSMLRPVIEAFDLYLQNGGMYNLITMYNQGAQEYREYCMESSLTDEERAYLAAHQAGGEPVRVLAGFDKYPSSFYNEQEQAWQGIAFDVLDEISTLCGLTYEVVNDPDEEWAQLVGRLESGEGVMVMEFIQTDERINSGEFLWTEEPYLRDQYALLSLNEHEDININQVLYSRIGLIQDSAYADVFSSWFPDHLNVTDYANTDEGFAALESGEIDLLMASRNLLLSATNYHEMPGYKANLVFDHTFKASFGFAKDQALLCSIVGKAQAQIDTETIAERWTSKVYDYRSKVARQQVPYLIGLLALFAIVLVLLAVLFYRNSQMKKRLEVTVQERTAELVVASQAKSDFLSRMSHEIRTPLNAIMGMAQIAKKTAARESPDTVESIDQMMTASTHLLGILNDVLDMSKIEAGKFILAIEPFHMNKAIDEVDLIIGQRCGEKNIEFSVSLDRATDSWVLGDKLRLNQVLINLLGNAVKFTHEGGRIALIVVAVRQDQDSLTLRFDVSDNGIGMSEEQLSRLFVAFEQADSSISKRFGGTGLGLAISQNLVKLMGGEISVTSKENEGSTFTFTVSFPKTTPDEADALVQYDDAPDFAGKRILLAEDIEINRLIVRELLSSTGVEIVEAIDGADALKQFEASQEGYFDLIFMDIMMPNMDGYEAARAIRALDRPDARRVPIVAMTANAYREDIDRALEAGMNAHVAKPIDMEEVIRAMRESLLVRGDAE